MTTTTDKLNNFMSDLTSHASDHTHLITYHSLTTPTELYQEQNSKQRTLTRSYCLRQKQWRLGCRTWLCCCVLPQLLGDLFHQLRRGLEAL